MNLKNLINMGIGTIKGNLFQSRHPLDVMFGITNRCLSHCRYCKISSMPKEELSTREIYKLLNELAAAGTQRLGIWGGEPLLRDDLQLIINEAKTLGMYVTLDTNGYLLPRKLNDLKKLDHLVISLDGREPNHDRNREPGSQRKALQAIEAATGRLPFWTITVLTKYNLGDIDYILEKAERYKFETTFQVIHHNDVLGEALDNFLPADAQYRAAFTTLIAAKRSGARIASSLSYLRYALDWPDYSVTTMPQPFRKLRCYAGQLYCNIDPMGKFFPCSLLIGKTPGTDSRSLGVKRAFEGLTPIPCQSCIASCFIEHNLLYSLNLRTVLDRFRSLR